MVTLQNDLNEELLKAIFTDITDNGLSDQYTFFRTLAEKSNLTIERKSNISIVDESSKEVNIVKDEVIKIFPIGKHTMYEALITLYQQQDNQTNLVDTFYFLVMITPENNMFNCDFFDITQISGTNILEDDKYENFVLNQARQIITKEEDIKAFATFIKIIRQKTFDK